MDFKKIKESYLSKMGCTLHLGGPLMTLNRKLLKMDNEANLSAEFNNTFTSLRMNSNKAQSGFENGPMTSREGWYERIDPAFIKVPDPTPPRFRETKAFKIRREWLKKGTPIKLRKNQPMYKSLSKKTINKTEDRYKHAMYSPLRSGDFDELAKNHREKTKKIELLGHVIAGKYARLKFDTVRPHENRFYYNPRDYDTNSKIGGIKFDKTMSRQIMTSGNNSPRVATTAPPKAEPERRVKSRPTPPFSRQLPRSRGDSPLPTYMQYNGSRLALNTISTTSCKANNFSARDVQESLRINEARLPKRNLQSGYKTSSILF